MSFTFRIRFGGLLAFSPRLDGTKAWAFLVEASHIFLRPGLEKIPSHLPFIRFDPNDLQQGVGNLPAATVGLAPLSGLDLRILPGGREVADSLVITKFDPKKDVDFVLDPKNLRPDADSFAWVAPLKNSLPSNPKATRIRPDLLADSLKPEDARSLATRIHLNHGELSTSEFSASRNGGNIVYRFRNPSAPNGASDHRQLLAAEVALNMKIDDPFVEVRGMSFDGTRQFSLAFQPPAGSSDNRVDVKIMNEESDTILGVPRPPEPLKPGPRPQDRLFELFFDLTVGGSAVPRGLVLPSIDEVRNPTNGVAVGSPPCSPARIG
jgi:hypothetical protein